MDVVIAAAAVADYKPKIVATQKNKKADDTLIELENKRYFSIIRKDKEKSVLIGFALETENEIENAKGKIQKT
jgi:phosphopantothenoylcysteine decarboxylase/phosphopantothenate--cysteine ligase